MFHPIPAPVLERMLWLEGIDARDRLDGTPQARRLRQVAPETGRLLAILAASSPPGRWVEIGTSAGYSALWLSLAARQAGASVITIDIDPAKVGLARENLRLAGVDYVIEVAESDARTALEPWSGSPSVFWTPRRTSTRRAWPWPCRAWLLEDGCWRTTSSVTTRNLVSFFRGHYMTRVWTRRSFRLGKASSSVECAERRWPDPPPDTSRRHVSGGTLVEFSSPVDIGSWADRP